MPGAPVAAAARGVPTTPSSGSSCFKINFKKVDLPLPFLPINPTLSPRLMMKFPLVKMSRPEKEMARSFAFITFENFDEGSKGARYKGLLLK